MGAASTKHFSDGLVAGAQYINAENDEVGMFCMLPQSPYQTSSLSMIFQSSICQVIKLQRMG